MKILTKNIWLVTDVDCVSNEWIGGFSPLEIKIITQFAVHPILHLFCGNSQIGEIRVDINPKSQANMVMNVFDYIRVVKPNVVTILMDPIYCSVDKTAEWRRAYADVGMAKNDLYIYPYDAARTKVLFDWIKEVNPNRVIIKSSFITKVLKFAFTHNPEKKWIHIFGLRRRGIEWILNQHLDFLVSCDSQKWRLTPFWRTCHDAHNKGEKAKLKDDSRLYEFLTKEYLANMDTKEKQKRLF
jgi:hypothetical protein